MLLHAVIDIVLCNIVLCVYAFVCCVYAVALVTAFVCCVYAFGCLLWWLQAVTSGYMLLHAVSLLLNASSGLYAHRLYGRCRHRLCGLYGR